MQELYRTDSILCLNKPVKRHFDQCLSPEDAARYFPVHRLDFETSGVLLCAAEARVEELRSYFKGQVKGLRKFYLAGASQALPAERLNQRVEGFVGSRYRGSKKVRFAYEEAAFRGWHSVQDASLFIKPLTELGKCSFKGIPYEVELISGVRHQIRAFFSEEGATLCGDPLYGPEQSSAERLELHAWRLVLPHPEQADQMLELVAPLP